MTDPSDKLAALVRHFESIAGEHMRGLPIVNPRLSVEAVGFRGFGEHDIGVLISPWFMNLILIPGNDDYAASAQGEVAGIRLPNGHYDFTVSHDSELGTYLSAVLFRTVTDFPDQALAREIGKDIVDRIFTDGKSATQKPIGRRQLITGLRGR